METAIMAVVCLLLLATLYIITGGWKRYGGIRGLPKWARAQFRNGQISPSAQNEQTTEPATGVSPEWFRSALKTVYHDVAKEQEALERRLLARMEEIEQENRELKLFLRELVATDEKVQHYTDASSQTEPHASRVALEGAAEDSTGQSKPALHFQILDALQAGESCREIAKRLGVSETEVLQVDRLMRL